MNHKMGLLRGLWVKPGPLGSFEVSRTGRERPYKDWNRALQFTRSIAETLRGTPSLRILPTPP